MTSAQLNPMSSFEQQIPSLPSGIDPEVQQRINTLLEAPEPIVRPSISRRNSSRTWEAWWATDNSLPGGPTTSSISQEDENTNSNTNGETSEEGIFEFDPEDFRLPPSAFNDYVDNTHSKMDSMLPFQNFTANHNTSSAPIQELLDPPTPKIIARYYYLSERRPTTPPPIPPRRRSTTSQPPPPPLASLFAMLCTWVFSFFKCASDPEIKEYTREEIEAKVADVQVEAQVVEFDVPERVVGVVTLLHFGEEQERHVIPIIAQPKRVRQLWKDAGLRGILEDDYEKEIKGALMDLRRRE